MTKRAEYLKKMHATLEHVQVKASLAKLELRDVRRELQKRHDKVCDRLAKLGEATEDRWDALQQSFEEAWQSFWNKYDDVMAAHQEDQG